MNFEVNDRAEQVDNTHGSEYEPPRVIMKLDDAQNQEIIAEYFSDREDDFEWADFSWLKELFSDKFDSGLGIYKSVITPWDVDEINKFMTFAAESYQKDFAKIKNNISKIIEHDLKQDWQELVGVSRLWLWEDKSGSLSWMLSVAELPERKFNVESTEDIQNEDRIALQGELASMQEDWSETIDLSKYPMISRFIDYLSDGLEWLDHFEGLTPHQKENLSLSFLWEVIPVLQSVLDAWADEWTSYLDAAKKKILTPWIKNIDASMESLITERQEAFLEMNEKATPEEQKEFALNLFNDYWTTQDIIWKMVEGWFEKEMDAYINYWLNGEESLPEKTIEPGQRRELWGDIEELQDQLGGLTVSQKVEFFGALESVANEEVPEAKTAGEVFKWFASQMKDFLVMFAQILAEAGLLDLSKNEWLAKLYNERQRESYEKNANLDQYDSYAVEQVSGKLNFTTSGEGNVSQIIGLFSDTSNDNISNIMSDRMDENVYNNKFWWDIKEFMVTRMLQQVYPDSWNAELQNLRTSNEGWWFTWKTDNLPWSQMLDWFQKTLFSSVNKTLGSDSRKISKLTLEQKEEAITRSMVKWSIDAGHKYIIDQTENITSTDREVAWTSTGVDVLPAWEQPAGSTSVVESLPPGEVVWETDALPEDTDPNAGATTEEAPISTWE